MTPSISPPTGQPAQAAVLVDADKLMAAGVSYAGRRPGNQGLSKIHAKSFQGAVPLRRILVQAHKPPSTLHSRRR